MTRNWSCPKCSNTTFSQDELRATGGILAKLFDVQNKKFTTVSCKQCGYTEMYRRNSSTVGNIIDLLTN